MMIVLEIARFQPERSAPAFVERFEVEAEPGSRLLDALVHIQRRVDPTLVFRRSCGHGVCGSDAMIVNGRERLACKTLVKDVAAGDGAVVTVGPLRNLPVVRDLAVAEAPFFARYREVKPFLIAGAGEAGRRERTQSPEEQAKIGDAANCILCAACYSACPVLRDMNPRFIGPAALVQAARFLEDSRDRGLEERLPALDRPDGVWACDNRFECTRVCPRGIMVTKLINQTKRRLAERKKKPSGPA
jgi:succinate dehydrogenase / fumarate reductase iron-sulfur subunit